MRHICMVPCVNKVLWCNLQPTMPGRHEGASPLPLSLTVYWVLMHYTTHDVQLEEQSIYVKSIYIVLPLHQCVFSTVYSVVS